MCVDVLLPVGLFFFTCSICICCHCRITGCLCSLNIWWVPGCWQCMLLGSKGSRVQGKWSETSYASMHTVQALPSRFTNTSLRSADRIYWTLFHEHDFNTLCSVFIPKLLEQSILNYSIHQILVSDGCLFLTYTKDSVIWEHSRQ